MKRFLLILPVSLFFLFPLAAHPHMQLYSQCSLDFTDGELTGLWIQFEFDKFFSSEIIWGYDTDGNGEFDDAETGELKKSVLSSFQDYNYFTFIRLGKERMFPDRAEHFSARYKEEDDLFFRFRIPLDDFPYRDFYIAIYDATFFCACRLNRGDPAAFTTETFFRTEGTGIPPVEISIEENDNYPVYYNPQGAVSDMTTYNKWKPGLQTFIPEEIHVQF